MTGRNATKPSPDDHPQVALLFEMAKVLKANSHLRHLPTVYIGPSLDEGIDGEVYPMGFAVEPAPGHRPRHEPAAQMSALMQAMKVKAVQFQHADRAVAEFTAMIGSQTVTVRQPMSEIPRDVVEMSLVELEEFANHKDEDDAGLAAGQDASGVDDTEPEPVGAAS